MKHVNVCWVFMVCCVQCELQCYHIPVLDVPKSTAIAIDLLTIVLSRIDMTVTVTVVFLFGFVVV